MKTMYCSKYALTSGVTEHDGYFTHTGSFVPEGWTCTYWAVGKDVHDTKEAAYAAAEKMRQKKIASLEKQIAKLRAMTFDI